MVTITFTPSSGIDPIATVVDMKNLMKNDFFAEQLKLGGLTGLASNIILPDEDVGTENENVDDANI